MAAPAPRGIISCQSLVPWLIKDVGRCDQLGTRDSQLGTGSLFHVPQLVCTSGVTTTCCGQRHVLRKTGRWSAVGAGSWSFFRRYEPRRVFSASFSPAPSANYLRKSYGKQQRKSSRNAYENDLWKRCVKPVDFGPKICGIAVDGPVQKSAEKLSESGG